MRLLPQYFLSLWGVFLLLLFGCLDSKTGSSHQIDPSGDWPTYQGDPGRNQYSSIVRITPENVDQLEVAWSYATDDATESSQIQCNPIMLNGKLYLSSPQIKVMAFDAGTGEEIWRFDPFVSEGENGSLGVNRGITYWEDGADHCILFAAGEYLYALNADTGEPISSFGENGRTSLKAGLGERAKDLFVISNTPGAIFEDLLIIGTRVSEFADAAPGYIRAYDVRTGEVAWVFHTIPQPGEYGYDTWPEDAWQRVGGANAWAGMSVDHERGMVFIPTGSAAFDFYGGNRERENLFANCILALDARTGERKWHFQTTHHDIWDRDLPCPPNLATITVEGKKRDVVAQVTKQGFVFVLDRDTGEPIFSVEERPFPASDLIGEVTWPTQPIPVKPAPFARQALTEANLTRRTPEAYEAVRQRLSTLRTGQNFTPGSLEGTVIFPGFDGGAEWGGAAFDPETEMLYVNANEMPWVLTMVEVDQNPAEKGKSLYLSNCAACHGQQFEGGGGGMGTYPALTGLRDRLSAEEVKAMIVNGKGVMPSFRQLDEEEIAGITTYLLGSGKESSAESESEATEKVGLPYAHTGYHKFLDPEGYPAVNPPWGTLTAIDLGKGEIAWQRPLGFHPELAEQGMAETGCENYGGGIVTAGGLFFIAATQDGFIRAFDKQTGEELWRSSLPAGGYATPALYEIEGKPYLVIACGGGKMGTPSGDQYVAFSLPD